ncbi:DUF1800 domain-containing protein [Aureispira anguillae]|uniref:DUF1800 domain-containing protein n=1 Tax=Aureispira anguillae TaxID=2864201 RepID=A0A915YIK8_9BACT|nr:DUF1800 domain-containing protein [Aureispira anguillae]BDS13725.1 DUF1800 domain-containing protein [Aureispira anguillae]
MLHKILNRISFGPTPASLAKLNAIGLEAYLEEQLAPSEEEAPILIKKKAAFRFNNKDIGAKDQGFNYIHASIEQLWEIAKDEKTLAKKGRIPAAEVLIDTCFNAIYSQWQLREILVHFWHNHFNVSINADERIAVTLPLYDRDVIRKNCLGNFRDFLEAVAKSQAMLFYLNNASSRASPANENFARELFELHTLGEENYWNHLYNKWREVPGATAGKAEGYIDEDIYEAARAFTGWTVADGAWTEGGEKPNTGAFLYLEAWHDNYQKRILGVEFQSNQAPLADGQKVLDLLAYHRGTAQFICTKLCIKFIADHPPQSIVDKAVKTWMQHQQSPEQIKQVVRTILLSEEFKNSLGSKVKNPFELLISMIRALELDFSPNLNLQWMLQQMGYHLFTWSTPTGHPDKATYWLNSSMLLKRWNLMPTILFDDWHKMVRFDADALPPSTVKSSKEIVQFWLQKILGTQHGFSPAHQQKLIDILLVENKTEDDPPLTYGKEDRAYRFAHVISLILMAPQFQYR